MALDIPTWAQFGALGLTIAMLLGAVATLWKDNIKLRSDLQSQNAKYHADLQELLTKQIEGMNAMSKVVESLNITLSMALDGLAQRLDIIDRLDSLAAGAGGTSDRRK